MEIFWILAGFGATGFLMFAGMALLAWASRKKEEDNGEV